MSHYSSKDTRTTTQRGLGWQHQQQRKRLLPAAIGTRCPGPGYGHRSPKCTGLMVNPKLMQLDHTQARALGGTVGDRIICKPCNLSSGAQLGNVLQQRALRGRVTVRNQTRRVTRRLLLSDGAGGVKSPHPDEP